MGIWLVDTERAFQFVGRMNDDVNTYLTLGNRGDLFFLYTAVQADTAATQSQAGGMTDIYLDRGTYVKSFYTVMFGPSYARIGTMGRRYRRPHHRVYWDRALPKLIAESHRKE
jgi:hypothetical protein